VTFEVQDVMNQLAAELKRQNKNQRKIDELNKKLDELLGTKLEERDHSREAAWERSRR
jgi:hypothetical protein